MVETVANRRVHAPSEGDSWYPAPIHQDVSPVFPDLQSPRFPDKLEIQIFNAKSPDF